MKYVRTRDGRIIDINEKYKSFIKAPYKVMNISKENYIKRLRLNIVKEADTIEELCDEFVWKRTDFYENSDKPYHYIRSKESFISEQENIKAYGKPEYLNVYGAIWTDKGLIYVAKMNEKGEMELL